MTRPAPILMRSAGRFGALGRGGAIMALAALPLLGGVAVLTVGVEAAVGDLPAAILDGTRHGSSYYQAAADALRSSGEVEPSAWVVPTPLVPLLRASLPDWLAGPVLWTLAGGAWLAWYGRLAPLFAGRIGRMLAGALLAGGIVGYLSPDRLDSAEAWAGLLVALSLALRTETRWPEAVALGLAAAVIAPAALPYLAVSLVLAAHRGLRGEAAAWTCALGLGAVVAALHLAAVERVAPGAGLALPAGGEGLAAGAWRATAPSLLPVTIAAVLLATALWGWASRAEPVAVHALAAFVLWSVLASAIALPFGPVAAAVLPAGLAFVPDALSGAWAAASVRARRITVTRVVR